MQINKINKMKRLIKWVKEKLKKKPIRYEQPANWGWDKQIENS